MVAFEGVLVHLEARYIGHDPKSVSYPCETANYYDRIYNTKTGADGGVMRSVIARGYLLVTGFPVEIGPQSDWTHITCEAANVEGAEITGIRREHDGTIRFTLT